jgi:RimJ/RimL family protein N-acetyltransferase
MNVREIVHTDRLAYRQLRATLDEESMMWGAKPGERESLSDNAGAQFDRVIGNLGSKLFVAEEGGTLAGFLSLETSAWASLAHTSTLMVGVHLAHQGKGVASQLFERAQLWASNNGIHRIELLVFANNISAIRLYEKLGYWQEGSRKQSSYIKGQFIDEIYMAKLL